MTRILGTLVLLSSLGWAAYWIIETYELFETAPQFKPWIYAAGLTVTAVAIVGLLATFFLRIVLVEVFLIQPSGLVHAVVYSGLTFAASILLLGRFGIDVGAILTTSAILGAVVGLSMQSTLGSIISGMSMSAEPLLKIGSAIRLDDRTVFIEQKTWRHVVGRRLDNIKVIIPNSMLANMAIQVLPEDGPTRFDVFLHLPPDVPPQRVTDLLADAFSDMDHLDATRAVMVAPIETQPEMDSIQYRIRLWARTYSQVSILQGEIPRRAWYILDRAGIHQPRNLFYESRPWPRLTSKDLMELVSSVMPDDMHPDVQGEIRQYRFAPSELLQFPQEDFGRSVMILRGDAIADADIYLNPMEHGRSARPHLPALGVQKLSTIAAIRKIADRLAQDVGPVAENLVRDAMKTAPDHQTLVAQLSAHIDDDGKRQAFMAAAKTLGRDQSRRGPGTIVRLAKDAAGRLMPNPELRALTEVLAVSFPGNHSQSSGNDKI